MERSPSLDEIPRDAGLSLVGALIYSAISPDLVDGFSDDEFTLAKDLLPKILPMLEEKEGSFVPNGVRLPTGFTEHYTRDVIPDMERVRSDPAERSWVRAALMAIVTSPEEMSKLYRPGGATYSGILAVAAGDRVVPAYQGADLGVPASSKVAGYTALRRLSNDPDTWSFAEDSSEITGVLQTKQKLASSTIAYHKRKRRRKKAGKAVPTGITSGQGKLGGNT